MRTWLQSVVFVCLALSTGAVGWTAPETPGAIALLNRYARGEFTPVVAALVNVHDFDALLKQLKAGGDEWIAAGGLDDRPRRQLAAATFALEAARVDAWNEWKIVQQNPPFPDPSVYWRAPPLLIKWGSALFLRDENPRPIEHWWQLAALSVAERSEDFEFLIGSPFEHRGNPGDEIQFLRPLFTRFPKENRFVLAQAIALEWRTWPDGPRGRASSRPGGNEAQEVFQNLLNDPAVGGEAAMRLGALRLRTGAVTASIDLFSRAEDHTRDPYVLYLARYFKGQAFERIKRIPDAERAYRGALEAIPRAQSASMALAALLFRREARLEASAVVNANLSSRPQPVDPWRAYADADDRLWPELVTRLRAEIHP